MIFTIIFPFYWYKNILEIWGADEKDMKEESKREGGHIAMAMQMKYIVLGERNRSRASTFDGKISPTIHSVR